MRVAEQIEKKLTDAFAPTRLAVIDESEQHRGHSGYREGGQTHFRVEIAAPVFDDMSRVARQRAIYKVLDAELKGPVHALALSVNPA